MRNAAARLAEKNFALADALAEQGDHAGADQHWQEGAFWAEKAALQASIRASR